MAGGARISTVHAQCMVQRSFCRTKYSDVRMLSDGHCCKDMEDESDVCI